MGNRNWRSIFDDIVTLSNKFIWNGGNCSHTTVATTPNIFTRFA
jgi:hypothetical protein